MASSDFEIKDNIRNCRFCWRFDMYEKCR